MLLNSPANGNAERWLMTSFITLMNLPIAHADLPIHDVIVGGLRPFMVTSRKRRSKRDNSSDAARTPSGLQIYFIFIPFFLLRFALEYDLLGYFHPLRTGCLLVAVSALYYDLHDRKVFFGIRLWSGWVIVSWCGVRVQSRGSQLPDSTREYIIIPHTFHVVFPRSIDNLQHSTRFNQSNTIFIFYLRTAKIYPDRLLLLRAGIRTIGSAHTHLAIMSFSPTLGAVPRTPSDSRFRV